jgi:hypothetical protein
MRRIIVPEQKFVTDDLISKPRVADGMSVKFAEANDANTGLTNLKISGTNPKTYQDMELEIQKSGLFTKIHDQTDGHQGATCSLLLNEYKDSSGNDVLSTDPEATMGQSDHLEWRRWIPLDAATNGSDELWHPKIVRLNKQHQSDTESYIGMVIWAEFENAGSRWQVHGALMEDTTMNYSQALTTLDVRDALGLGAMTSRGGGATFGCDAVELEDGSILLVVFYEDEFAVFRSFNGVNGGDASWQKLYHDTGGTPLPSGVDCWFISVETIGNRIVVAFSTTDATAYFKSAISDDGGYTWGSDNNIETYGMALSISQIDLSKDHDGKLWAVMTFGLGVDGVSSEVYVSSSTDGVNWTADTKSIEKTMEDATEGAMHGCMTQLPHGGWVAASCAAETSPSSHNHVYTMLNDEPNPANADWIDDRRLDNGAFDTAFDMNGMDIEAMNESAFIDLAVAFDDDNGFYTVGIYRFRMWSDICFYSSEVSAQELSDVWYAHCYPGGATNPRLTNEDWTEVADASTIISLDFDGRLRLDQNGQAVTNGVNYEKEISTGSGYSACFRFALDVDNAAADTYQIFRVSWQSDGGGAGDHVEIEIVFHQTSDGSGDEIILKDLHSGTTTTYDASGGWPDLNQLNEYVLLLDLGSSVEARLYVTPTDDGSAVGWSDIANYEEIITVSSLQKDAGTAPSYLTTVNSVGFGAFGDSAYSTVNDHGNWQFVAVKDLGASSNDVLTARDAATPLPTHFRSCTSVRPFGLVGEVFRTARR